MDLAKDRFVTHGITSYSLSSYQGKFAYLNILSQFGHPKFVVDDVLKIQQNLSKISKWHDQLYQDECLFSASWSKAETFEAEAAIDLVAVLKPELYQLAAEISRILGLKEIPTYDELVFLTACYAWQAFSRDAYVRSFIEYANKFALIDMEEKYRQLIPLCEADTEKSQHIIFEMRKLDPDAPVKDDQRIAPEANLLQLLFEASIPLPSTYRSHIHDINQILSQFKGGLSFATAEFTQAEADLWMDANIGPVLAGYWRAYGISIDEAREWTNIGVAEAPLAIEWRKGAFTPATCKEWIELKFMPYDAFVWKRAGYKPEEARKLLSEGVTNPPYKGE